LNAIESRNAVSQCLEPVRCCSSTKSSTTSKMCCRQLLSHASHRRQADRPPARRWSDRSRPSRNDASKTLPHRHFRHSDVSMVTRATGTTSGRLPTAGAQTRIRAWIHLTAESITKRLNRTTSRTDAQRLHTRRPTAEAVITTATCSNHPIIKRCEHSHLMQLAVVTSR
jgi:hypothetical protein